MLLNASCRFGRGTDHGTLLRLSVWTLTLRVYVDRQLTAPRSPQIATALWLHRDQQVPPASKGTQLNVAIEQAFWVVPRR